MDDSILMTLKEISLEKCAPESLDEFLTERLILENRVRKLKRMGQPCEFEECGLCSRLDIRCGERQQYDLPEETQQKGLPHQCNYQPNQRIGEFNILIVDDEPSILEMNKTFFKTNGADPSRIETAQSVAEAREILKRGKVLNRQYCIVMSDIKMDGETGFDLVNHLVERNYNSRVLLLSGCYSREDLPDPYTGDLEVVPGRKVVSKLFTKPLTMAAFSAEIRQIEKEFQPVTE